VINRFRQIVTINNTYKLVVNASTRRLAEVRQFVADKAMHFGFDEKQISDIRLAVDEACTNIIKHAYKYDESQNVEIRLKLLNNKLCVSLTDTGNAFDPNKYSKPDIREQMKSKKRGGVGVYLIRKLMDDVEYLKMDDHNMIRMYKNLN
jgi:serine/threonine-protein kinase RsbW